MLRRSARALLLPLLSPLLLAAGCAQLQGLVARPEAHVANATLQGLDLTGVNLAFDVVIGNPYDVDLPLMRFEYVIDSDGTNLAKGSDVGGARTIPAHGSSTLPVIAHVGFQSLLAETNDLERGSVVDYLATIRVNVQAPTVGNVRLPLEHKGSFPIPAVPDVALSGLRWESLSMAEATAVLDIAILNTNAFAVNLSHLAYDLKLGNTAVASASVDAALPLAGGAPDTLRLRFTFKPSELGLATFAMLSGGDATYDFGGTMTLGSVFGTLQLPFSRQGKVPFSR
ncbi:MAG TPA: LEA type 2 family protein [Planctomycetota bacterium]|nr:LEA type 2 family protein [Planctomycetota bacterium]